MSTKSIKTSFYALLGIFMLIIINSCNKESTKNDSQEPSHILNEYIDDNKLIKNAKLFFETSQANVDTVKDKALSSYKSSIGLIGKTIVWDSAFVSTLSTGRMVMAPVKYERDVVVKIGTNKLSLNSLTWVYIRKDKKGTLKTEVVLRIPDESYFKNDNPNKSFSGIINVSDWKGNFIKAFRITNGISKRLGAPETHKVQYSSYNPMSLRTNDVTCTLYWWGYCDNAGDAYSDCDVTDYDLYCPSNPSGDNDEDDAGDYTGGGTDGVPTVPDTAQEVKNNLTDPCDSLVLAKLMSVNLTGNIANVIHNVFATSTTAHLTFDEFNDPAAKPARSTVLSGSSSSNFDVTVSINTAAVGNSSQEFRATLMIHESIHAFMNLNNQYFENQLRQHQLMADNYVQYMRVLLQSIYPINDANAYSLVLNGLSDTFGNNKPAYLSTLYNKYNVSNPLLLYEYHRAGVGGTGCPTN
jgi:hypothetical protein